MPEMTIKTQNMLNSLHTFFETPFMKMRHMEIIMGFFTQPFTRQFERHSMVQLLSELDCN